jgi:hypothetical protein
VSKPLPTTLVTRLELAEHFKVSIRTVSVWDKLRLIPRIKAGSVIRYDPKAVMAAITSQSMNDVALNLALCDFQDIQLAAKKGTDAEEIERNRVLRSTFSTLSEVAIVLQKGGVRCPLAEHPDLNYFQRLLVGLSNPEKIDGLMASIKGVVEASL